MNAPRILVTGGQGKLGGALARLGCDALPRTRLDITQPAQIAAVLNERRPDVVINTASYTAVDAAESHEDDARAINAAGAANLATLCASSDIPLIHISTDMVFGDGDPEKPLDEGSWAAPESVYGATKLEGETMVRSAGGRHTVCRVSWLFGDDCVSFASKMLELAAKRDTLSIVTDEIGRPTPIDDLAGHLVKLAELMVAGKETPPLLHLGPGPVVSRFGWAQEIFMASADAGGPAPEVKEARAADFGYPARRPRGVVLDTGRADALLGPMPDWRPANVRAVKSLLKT
ncbi:MULTISPECIES: dTDP-4-dehydrorhamnose reductase [Henriciella]|jgi:dTDP-4-dehydrorhamnose reductase|uniref:dTDP-4-dehydrorhamnose reductase n=1 Tax=Henriciella TaxID=453849 RepID=UPI003515DCBF